ncbi:MAG: hydrogen peroxide-inducible genes activator [Bacteroidetes bacterium QH_2_63_10]|nr:MAG: hydrogen peroxide-inducible genes activator [Bacteroidetes bacterium QH_2_63_10]
MTLAQLQYFVALDTHRHFGDAAVACDVTQPTLSGQLRRLEEELDVQLIDRSRQPVVPTATGERVVEEARAVLAARDRLTSVASEMQDRVTGTLRLGMLPTLSPYLLPLLLPALETDYPELSFVLREWSTHEILDALQTDTLDGALIATDETGPDLRDRVLFTEPFVGYVAPSHRLADRDQLTPADLSIEYLWLLSEGHCFRDQVLHVCGRSPSVPQAAAQFESGSLETLVRLVRNSGGMTLLPRLATHHMPETERSAFVIPFADPAPTRDVRLVTPRRHKQRLVDAVVETIHDTLPDTVGLH